MPLFKYKARKLTGETETGTLDAPNQDSVITSLQQKGLIVLSVSKSEEVISAGKIYKTKLHSGIRGKDLIMFATQLTTTLRANIPLLKCLEIQVQQTTSRKFKRILQDIRDNVSQGRTLKESLAKYPKIFSSMWLNLVETGEASGQLYAILNQLAEYLIASHDLRRKTITALIYPAILLSVGILAIYIFSIKVIPIFEGIFKDFNMELPLITRLVIGTSTLLRTHIIHTVIVVAILVYAVYRYINTEKGKRVLDSLVFKLPLFGNFFLNSAIEKFSSSLGILLHSGIPILQAINIVAKTSGNTIIEEALNTAYVAVREGKPLSSSLSHSQIFPPITISMCSVGEETGELDKMLEEVTKYYRDEMKTFIERLSVTIEPIVIIVMAGFVAVILFAMYMPIFNIALIGSNKK